MTTPPRNGGQLRARSHRPGCSSRRAASTQRSSRQGSTCRPARSTSPRTSAARAGGPTGCCRARRRAPSSSPVTSTAPPGAGAFFGLKEAKVGDRVQVTTKNGRRFTYKVISIDTMPKAKLPPAIFPGRVDPASSSSPAAAHSSRVKATIGTTSWSPRCRCETPLPHAGDGDRHRGALLRTRWLGVRAGRCGSAPATLRAGGRARYRRGDR